MAQKDAPVEHQFCAVSVKSIGMVHYRSREDSARLEPICAAHACAWTHAFTHAQAQIFAGRETKSVRTNWKTIVWYKYNQKTLAGKLKHLGKPDTRKQVFLHAWADLWCCFDPLFDAPLPPWLRYHIWFSILCVWMVFLYLEVNEASWQVGCNIA